MLFGIYLHNRKFVIREDSMPVTKLHIPTFADDTAFLTVNKNHKLASQKLRRHTDKLKKLLRDWKIKVND